MATVEKAEELLEKLRSASWNAAVQGRFYPLVFFRLLSDCTVYLHSHWELLVSFKLYIFFDISMKNCFFFQEKKHL